MINLKNDNGDTPLLIFVKHNKNFQTLLLLLQAGANTLIKDKNGKYPYQLLDPVLNYPVFMVLFQRTIQEIIQYDADQFLLIEKQLDALSKENQYLAIDSTKTLLSHLKKTQPDLFEDMPETLLTYYNLN